MSTRISAISPRLVAAVSDDPAAMLAAAASELAHRWENCERGTTSDGPAEWNADMPKSVTRSPPWPPCSPSPSTANKAA